MSVTKARQVIGWSRVKKAYTVSGGKRCLAGVHPTLKAVFYPKYKYSLAKLGATTPHSDTAKQAKVTKFKPSKRAGSSVDNEFRKIASLVLKYSIPMRVFIDEETKKTFLSLNSHNITKYDKSMIKTKVSIASKSILRVLMKLGLNISGSQVRVGCQQLGIATAADLTCTDHLGRTVVIEIKLGYEHYFHLHSAVRMHHVNETDSVYNQTQLQLFLTHELYRRTHPTVPMGNPLLIRVSGVGLDCLPLESWVIEKSHIIFKALSNRVKK
jgi:hypothetical protein